MILAHLYTFTRWPESIPLYRMQYGQSFLFGWRVKEGFDKHPYNLSMKGKYYGVDYQDRTTNGMSNRVPCLPLESKRGD